MDIYCSCWYTRWVEASATSFLHLFYFALRNLYAPSMTFCSECGAQAPAGSFCSGCGTRLPFTNSPLETASFNTGTAYLPETTGAGNTGPFMSFSPPYQIPSFPPTTAAPSGYSPPSASNTALLDAWGQRTEAFNKLAASIFIALDQSCDPKGTRALEPSKIDRIDEICGTSTPCNYDGPPCNYDGLYAVYCASRTPMPSCRIVILL